MPWYKSGTVSVTLNSNAVVGTNTAFIANSRVGDAFRGPDGRWYEVTNIASDTAMSISPGYQGATASGGAYALAPMQGYVKDSADALRTLVNQFGAKLAALGTTGNYDTLPVSKGGTGGTDQASGRAGLGLGTASTLTAGTTAGAVMPIQQGSWFAPSSLSLPAVTDLYNMNAKTIELAQYAFTSLAAANAGGAQSQYGLALAMKGSANEWRHVLQFTTDGDIHDLFITNPSSGGTWSASKFYTTRNTTRAADGTLKAI
jgi:hypothetical protein